MIENKNHHLSIGIRISVGSNGCLFEVKIRPPKYSSEIEFVAFVLFNDMNLGIHVGNALKEAAENGTTLEMGPINHIHEVRFLNFLLIFFS